MNRSTLLLAACLFDAIAGDPEWFPHPVRMIGHCISRGEEILRRPDQSSSTEFIAGATLTFSVVGATYWLTKFALDAAGKHSPALADTTELFLAWTCLAARNLNDEARAVLHALEADDLPSARKRIARIVGRDTATLNASEISRALIETVAESLSDGVTAPIFYMALGGAPLAMAYKAVNTLDSMIGHADARYFYFGKFAARLDDVANLIPSRLTAVAIVAAASALPRADSCAALRIWKNDGSKHKSPNAGQPESAMAGALHVCLGGRNTYAGEVTDSPRMGTEFSAPMPEKVAQCLTIATAVGLIGLVAGVLFSMQRRKP